MRRVKPSPAPHPNKRRRVTKRVARELGSQALKNLLTELINFSGGKRLADVKGAYLTNQTTLHHWYYDEEAWHLPAPNAGGRDIAFNAFMGTISKSSVLRQTCHERECINPFHCTILTRSEAAQRDKGTWQVRMIAPERKVITKEEYEATLCDGGVKERVRLAKRKADIREAKALDP